MSREARSAATMLLLCAANRASSAGDRRDWVAQADARTSASDARTALSIACGRDLADIDPSNGTAP